MSQKPASLDTEPGFWTKTSLIQFGYGVWVNLTLVVIGLAFGFSAVALPQLLDSDSTIKITLSDQSWITSVLTILSPFGCVFSGYMMDRIGRRLILVLCHVPAAVGWLYTAIATSARDLIIGRMITGFSLGMIVFAPRPYLSEIALPNMRGVIGTFPNLALSIGVTLQAGLGSYFRWQTLCYINMFYSIILMFCNFLLPETPYYLLLNNKIEKAEASLRKFRAADYDVETEMKDLKEFKTGSNIHSLSWKEKLRVIFKRSSCKPFCIIMVYFMITQLSGISVMPMWTVQILQRSKSSVDPHTGNIFLGFTRFFSGLFTSFIIFRVGRRPLALISCLGVGLANVVVAPYIIHTRSPTVFPLICYVISITSASLGYYTLPVLIMSEIFPLQVRGILGGFSTSINYFLIFAVNKMYPYMTEAFGFPYAIMSFGVFSLLGCIFLFFFLPETKGLKLQEIEEYYKDRRPTISDRQIRSSIQLSPPGLHKTDASNKLLKTNKSDKKQDDTKLENRTDEKAGGSTSYGNPS